MRDIYKNLLTIVIAFLIGTFLALSGMHMNSILYWVIVVISNTTQTILIHKYL